MSINSTVPLIRPPAEGAQSRRAALMQAGPTTASPFAGVLAQESQGKGLPGAFTAGPAVAAAVGKAAHANGIGGMGGLGSMGAAGAGAGAAAGAAAAGPFSAVMAATAQGTQGGTQAATQAGSGTQGKAPGRMPGDRPIPPMPERNPGMPSGAAQVGGHSRKGGKEGAMPATVAGLGQNTVAEATRANLARANNLAQVQMDKQRTQALENLSQNMGGDSPLDMARNSVTMRNLRTVVGGFSLRAPVVPMADSIKSQALRGAQRAGGAGGVGQAEQPVDTAGIGKLAAQFESGSDGIAAIGYDRVGGTSYGKYQIASRVGSMDSFLKFLDTAAPDMSQQLRASGPANTGGRRGAMPDTWRKLATEQPDRFEALQEKFIYDSHYKPALEAVAARTPLDEDRISSAMQEVLWSTAVQHGPAGAARIFTRATEGAGKATDKNYDKKVINNVYAIRAEQFGSSTEQVQQSVRSRMHREKKLALNMLEQGVAHA